MKHEKYLGFTLIEVILAMAIFAIISVSFFTMFSTIYTNNYLSSAATENIYQAQDEMEVKIASVKDAINNDTVPTGYTTSTVQMFSGLNQRSVTVYRVTQDNPTGRTLESFIASSRPPELIVPVIRNGVSIGVFLSSDTVHSTEIKYPNIGMDNLTIGLSEDIDVSNEGYLVRYLYYWYLSSPNNYVLNSPPTFPDDYEIITSYSSDTIPTIPASYAGRFVKLVVTPVGEKGKMGTSVESNAVYISPMTINTNLMFHADASFINIDDSNQVRNATVGTKVYSYIKSWVDRSAWALNMSQSDPALQPVVYQYSVGDTTNNHMVLGSLGISGISNQNLKTTTTPSIGTKADITIYFAALIEEGFPNNTILFQSRAGSTSGNRFVVKTENSTGKLQIIRYLGSSTSTRTISSKDTTFMNGEWNIYKLEIYSDRLSIEINGIDQGFVDYSDNTQVMYFLDFQMKFDYRMTIGELMVYGTTHPSDDDESIAIYKYLNDKFRP